MLSRVLLGVIPAPIVVDLGGMVAERKRSIQKMPDLAGFILDHIHHLSRSDPAAIRGLPAARGIEAALCELHRRAAGPLAGRAHSGDEVASAGVLQIDSPRQWLVTRRHFH